MLKDMLEFNKNFVKEKKYEQYITSKYPDKNRHTHLYGYSSDRASPRSSRH